MHSQDVHDGLPSYVFDGLWKDCNTSVHASFTSPSWPEDLMLTSLYSDAAQCLHDALTPAPAGQSQLVRVISLNELTLNFTLYCIYIIKNKDILWSLVRQYYRGTKS